MAVAYRSHNILALARTNSTLTAPSGIANGDLLLAIITGGDSGDQDRPDDHAAGRLDCGDRLAAQRRR